jgi:hypothetical protein
MNVYKVKFVSQRNALIQIVFSLFAFFASSKLFSPHGTTQNKAILGVIIVAVIFWCFWQFFVTGRTEWEINDEMIKIHWTKPFVWSGNNDDDIIYWTDIENIYRGLDPKYYSLNIILLDGRKVRFYHNNLTTRDDFAQMMDNINRRMETIKKERA